ncbi:MAG: molybdopterin molybdotransferase MoeA [Phycisphaerales bacterium]|nr:molybdopterin molybdotransferase MoeA [Phycisphaerales bacterium]
MNDAPSIPTGFAFESPASALAALVARIEPVGTEQVCLSEAPGRVLAEALVADRPSPACDVSAMDGYAIGEQDLRLGAIPIAGDIAMGASPPIMPTGAVLRIFTGAPVPDGVFVVIRREDCIEHDGGIELTAQTIASAHAGANIRRRGENCSAGAEVALAGQPITPACMGALAAMGLARPRIYARLRVAVLTTGDEVLPAESSPEPWQLRDANGPALLGLLSSRTWIDLTVHACIPDDERTLGDTFEQTLDSADAIICCGGVSMGQRDFVPATIRACGGEIIFHCLPQKPGKPALGAVTRDGRPILGLPGNPVSVLVTARRLALPALSARGGLARPEAPALVRITNPASKPIALWHHRPVRLTAPGEAECITSHSSGDIPAVATSDGFVEVPPNAANAGPFPFYAWC